MVRDYLWYILGFWIIEHDLPADELSEYDEYIENMKMNAIRKDELDTLKLAFDHILANSKINTESLADSDYPWDDAEICEIIRYAYQKIWSNTPPIDPVASSEVKLVKIPIKKLDQPQQ
ncbi:MAG TPA: hypothetical protein VK184_21030 [Nostocaceae cyanobacterium]|nr:hypothetical protein [Nostocaceae cyanobacterium]